MERSAKVDFLKDLRVDRQTETDRRGQADRDRQTKTDRYAMAGAKPMCLCRFLSFLDTIAAISVLAHERKDHVFVQDLSLPSSIIVLLR